MSRTYASGKTKKLLNRANCFANASASCILGEVYSCLYNKPAYFPYEMTAAQCNDFNNRLLQLSDEKWNDILKIVTFHFEEHTTEDDIKAWVLAVSKYFASLKAGYICL